MAAFILALALCIYSVTAQVLQPEYIDIAKGKQISSSATCGEGLDKEAGGKELFCKLAQAPGRTGIKGQYCDNCYPGNHSVQFAVDGTEKWWQSPSLSRGLHFENVNITIDLGQIYHVAYIIIKAANSPRPGIWSLMRSKDGGKTFSPWYNFASTPSECLTYHQMSHLLPITRDDTVQCKLEYSQVPPFENGEIHISLVNNRPGASNFSASPALQDWTTASHVRLHFMKVKTLLGDLMPLSLQDPTVTRRYYYSIKEVSIGGRCMCNGFADKCDEGTTFKCQCQHFTCGPNCDRCCDGYIQKKWQPRYKNENFICEPCNCHGHSQKCQYSEQVAQRKISMDIHGNMEGGGVCEDCQDNTYGINCEKCKPYYFRPAGIPITSKDACQSCNCSFQTSTGHCADGTGQCNCKPNFAGTKCDKCNVGFFNYPLCEACICDRDGSVEGSCAPNAQGRCQCKKGYTGAFCNKCDSGYYGFPKCQPCNCFTEYGALSEVCDVKTGQCECREGYGQRACDRCLTGYFNFPLCKRCDCDPAKTKAEICLQGSGECVCKDNYSGLKCDKCADGYFGYPSCQSCGCSSTGSSSTTCDKLTGKCSCLPNFRGAKCDQCSYGYYGYPACLKCNCDRTGSYGEACRASDGQCSCRSQFQGRQCNKCQPGFYGFPNCQQCRCNPAGTKSGPGGIDCSSRNNGECTCKDNVQGKECTECKSGFFSLQASNSKGCTNCDCHRPGTNNGLLSCSKLTGKCNCKRYVASRNCKQCKDGFYELKEVNYFGCKGCDCDVGGSFNQNCSKADGQCKCRANVVGRKCDKAKPGYYAPTLHQIAGEIENGRTPEGNVLRFDKEESKFPGFTGRGFSMINEIQPKIIATVNVFKKSNYQIMFHYVLNQLTTVTANVVVYPSGQRKGFYSGDADFPTTQTAGSFTSKYSTITKEGDPLFFPLTPGKWDIEISAPPSALLLDKVILVPEEYVDALQLKEKIIEACQVNKDQKMCNQFLYLDMKRRPGFVTIEAELNQDRRKPVVIFNDTQVLSMLDFNGMAKMSRKHNQLDLDIEVSKSGKYVFVVQYYHDSPITNFMDLYLRTYKRTQRGGVYLYRCKYKFGCRQVAIDDNKGGVKVYDINANDRKLITLFSRRGTTIGIDSVTAIPLEKWNMDYVTPEPLCTTENNKCTTTTFPFPKKSIKMDAVSKIGQPAPPNVLDPSAIMYISPGSLATLPSAKLPAGKYKIIAHYYQPKHAGFDAQVSVDNVRSFRGVVKFGYCPHTFGCRALVKNGGDSNTFTLADFKTAVRLTVPSGKDVWVDHFLFVPESAYTPALMDQNPTSLVSDFRKMCSKDDFYIKPTIRGFCREGTFSLTVAFNNGTLPCGCDKRGSQDQNCEELGGQCRCNSAFITGRTCNRCRLGYYGFPNCKACKTCSNCDEVTGECKCPPGTIGEKCEKCKPGTFGYDPVVGCGDCKCDPFGTKNGNQTCDVVSGQCPCKDNFGGRKCSECRAGFYGKPACKKCFCNEAGITEKKCDSDNGKCICKPSVTGAQCDQCVSKYFKTAAKKPINLCSQCWCSRRSSKCSEAFRYRKSLGEIIMDPKNASRSEWSAPSNYLNDMVLAYGGYIDVTQKFPVGKKFKSSEENVVTLQGLKYRLLHKKMINVSDGATVNYRVPFYEAAWTHRSGSPVSRYQFLETMAELKEMSIKASNLSAIRMSTSADSGIDRAYGIESCQCPTEYVGTSCEKCAKGYTRAINGSCVKCECNGKASECDPETGVCIGCKDNTMGDKCEKCKPGFFGDKCKPCECPMSVASNNFATSCSLDASRNLKCQCKPGYMGMRCDKCADGYFGNPLAINGSCKPCQCNGNIDKNLTGNCDQKTGECFKCLKNTDGVRCEKCRIGYYGDAIKAKNCTNCKCSSCGSANISCDQMSGQCECKKNVEGKRCSKCKPNTWNYKACLGCDDCKCGPASKSMQCNQETGQCQCRDGVMGRQCDWCKLGYHSYSAQGCKKCQCSNGSYCDVKTGSCDCGVSGEKCTLCPPGHIITGGKCVKCDNCVQRLLKRVEVLDANYTAQLSHSFGISKVKSLTRVNQTLKEIERRAESNSDFNLETMKKAIGFGKYGSHGGDMGYHEVYEFSSCRFDMSMTMVKNHSAAMTTAPMTTAPMTTANPVPDTVFPDPIKLKTTPHTEINRKKRALDGSKQFGFKLLRRLYRRAALQDPSIKNETCPASLAKVLRETGIKMNRTVVLMHELSRDSKKVSANSSAIEVRAKDMLGGVKRYVKGIEGVVLFANETLMNMMMGSNFTNGTVSEIQRIQQQLKNRNFTKSLMKSGMEKNMAENASKLAHDLLNKTMLLHNLVKDRNDTVGNIIRTFLNINNMGVKEALGNTGNSTKLIMALKQINPQAFIDAATEMVRNYNMTLMSAMNMTTDAKSILDEAIKIFEGLKKPFEYLEGAMSEAKNRSMLLEKGLKNLKAPIKNATKHADGLENQATILHSLIKDTKNFSDSAVRAAKVYSNIVEGIMEALAAAREANITASSANQMAQVAKSKAATVAKNGEELETKSNKLSDDVDGLENPFAMMKADLAEIKKLKEEAQALLKSLRGKTDAFKADAGIGDRANKASADAKDAAKKAKDALDFSQDINGKIKDTSKNLDNLKTNVSNINKLIDEGAREVNNIYSIIPGLSQSLNEVKRLSQKLDENIRDNVTQTVDSIRYKIGHARSLANLAPLAVTFKPGSSVSLDSPIVEGESTTVVDMNIKTKNGDAFLFFAGNGAGRSKRDTGVKSNDYLALSIVNGFVTFSGRAGDAELELQSPQSVVDGKWYAITATRSFNTMKLDVGVANETARKSVNAENPQFTTMKLSKKSDIFVGGVPSGKSIPKGIPSNSFIGCADRISIDNEVKGLWNWKTANTLSGCVQQEKKLPVELQFSGDGFIKYRFDDGQNKFRKVSFTFRTVQKDALLLYGPSTEFPGMFASFELKNGFLIYRYNSGDGSEDMMVSSEGYLPPLSDGKEHKVEKLRGSLKIDKIQIGEKFDKSTQSLSANYAFVGGVPFGEKMVTSVIGTKAFKGCFPIITFPGQQKIDVSKQTNVLDFKSYSTGCSSYVAKAAAFTDPTSYLAINATSCGISAGKSLSFSFQTYLARGVLLYGKGTGDAGLNLIINDAGAISMSVKSGKDNTLLVSYQKNLNDGNWHLVQVLQSDKKLVLAVDGQKKDVSFDKDVILDGKMYLGGLPASVKADAIKTFSLQFESLLGNIKNIQCNSVDIDLGSESLELNKVMLAEKQLAPLQPPTTPPMTTAPVKGADVRKSEPATTMQPVPETTMAPAAKPMTTVAPTTAEALKTMADSTTMAPMTTMELTTMPPTTMEATTMAPTTQKPTTMAPTTEEPTTMAPTTKEPTTMAPTTKEPTTMAPTTQEPTTMAPTTQEPTTMAPTTQEPTTMAPTTEEPTTMAPTTLPKDVPCASFEQPLSNGYSFGQESPSYVTFPTNPGALGTKSKYSFEISTYADNGIIMISEKSSNVFDYEIIFLSGGKIVYYFNAGTGLGKVESTIKVNTGEWFIVSAQRNKKSGTLTVNGVSKSGTSGGGASFVNGIFRVHIGGAKKDLNTLVKVPKASRVSLKGCIRDLKLFDKKFTTKPTIVGVTGCFRSYKKSLYIGKGNGFGFVAGSKIGPSRTIEFTVRPQTKDGIILYTAGGGDFFSIQLIKGNVVVKLQNGAGTHGVSVKPTPGTSFCDGRDHKIVVKKVRFDVTLTVDNLPSKKVTGPKGPSSVDNEGKYFIGGIPSSAKSQSLKGLDTKASMRGCISKFVFNGKDLTSQISLQEFASFGCMGTSAP